MTGPFKMKGSPMKRNFGISPLKQSETTEKPKQDWAKAYKLASAPGSGATAKQIANLKQKAATQKSAQAHVVSGKSTPEGRATVQRFARGEQTLT